MDSSGKKKNSSGLKKLDFGFSPSKGGNRNASSKNGASQGGFDFLELIKAWESIIGKNFAKKTIPLKHKGDTLTILTEHSSYSAQLKFLEQVLIDKICKKFTSFQGKIKKINFQSNTTIFQEKMKVLTRQISISDKPTIPAGLHPQSPEYFKLQQEAKQSLGDFEDQDLKASLESLFIQMKSLKKDSH